ncbi:unnamed protein product [Penicillium nalgiovense]|uniref:Acyltransferase 3 domain-containing protein n=1 Tax=Penicillium nalgiovense TaxID=60175 RepID=A0A9W4HCZ1_PENNA|nr:unnamed protein product [Penicillium nalgiovense]CAG7952962.1 unnamed protein product [Penicillium nalgiovense]CAG7956860.1 unnamed protein product [Penicillium nalgiovense]CAG7958341.1 unnamed protein product [Penicillium nalgiovense]CAG7973845.1 unnamed protein product [Penicillium nalgiovense]
MDRTAWLDGLRGIAAAIVATDHYFMGAVFDNAFLSFWADPPAENRRLIQLPPIRIIFAAHAMVPFFLVISGYAISINLLRLRNRDGGDFVHRLSSAVSKRIFRIYLPVMVIAIISQEALDFTMVTHHLRYVFRYMLDIMNIINAQWNGGLNDQLWTMTMEFRGSCIVYVTVLGLAFWRPQLRRIGLAALIGYWFYFGVWDVFAFLAGLYLAETRLLSEANPTDEEFKSPHQSPKGWVSKLKFINSLAIWNYFCFLFGLYLVCLSDDGELPPGYQFLKLVESSRWEDDWEVPSRCWKTVGSVLLVYALSELSLLQRLFNARPIQYLGKISFSLYLVHQSVYHLVRDPVINILWYIATREPYPGTEDASKLGGSFAFTWLAGYVVMSAINLYTAHLYTKYIDERCVRMAKRIDKWLTRP